MQPGFMGDRQQEPENPALREALTALAAEDRPETRRDVYLALLDSLLLLPAVQPPGTQSSAGQPGHVSLMMAQTPDGRSVLLGFTDTEALRRWRSGNVYYMGLRAGELLGMAVHNQVAALILNPGGPASMQIGAADIALLANGVLPGSPRAVQTTRLPGQTRVNIGPPTADEFPRQAVLNRLEETLHLHRAVLAGYVFALEIPPQPTHTVIGIGMHPLPEASEADQILRQIVSQITAELAPHEELQFVLLRDSFWEEVHRAVEPIYWRWDESQDAPADRETP